MRNPQFCVSGKRSILYRVADVVSLNPWSIARFCKKPVGHLKWHHFVKYYTKSSITREIMKGACQAIQSEMRGISLSGLHSIRFQKPMRNVYDFMRSLCGFACTAIFWMANPPVFGRPLNSSQRFCRSLTHWGLVTHICVRKQTIIGSDNGLSPGRRQAIIWTNAGILLTGPLGTKFNEILIEIQTFSFKKMHLKTSSGK